MMTRYKQYKKSRREIERMTNEQIAKDQLWCIEARKQNDNAYNDTLYHYNELLKLCAQIYGVRSNELAYLRRRKPPKPVNILRQFERVRKQFDKVVQQRKQQYRADYTRRRKDAISWLEGRGLKSGVDFQPSRAITVRKQMESEMNDQSFEERFGV